ncbi:MAG TPA: cyclic nucleotide-binding domain-containing protein, partial [Lacipirellulaceae bacterium]|nr:cyclic nucleotide-binding domain-containing protein [Lacipirellulaceae bacterium]
MVDMEVAVARPQRWDAPFGPDMTDASADSLLAVEPFCSINPEAFPPTLPLRELLRNDVRVLHYAPGDVIVREGDYGSSAFLILAGQVRVVLSGLSQEELGRQPAHRLGWWETLWKVAARPRQSEVRDLAADRPAGAAAPGQTVDDSARRVFLQDVPRVLDSCSTAALGRGEIFGELAALTRSPRTATVLAEPDVTVAEIRWQGLRDLMRRTDALRRHVERLYRENSLRVHLRETPLLAALPPEQLEAVAEATVFESHGEFDWHFTYESVVRRRPGDGIVDEPLIVEEGTPCDGLVLIRTGFARQSQRFGAGHRTAMYLGRGQAFGLAESVETAAAGAPQPWRYSLRALGYVDILRIPQATLELHVFPYAAPDELVALARDHGARFASPASAEPAPAGPL